MALATSYEIYLFNYPTGEIRCKASPRQQYVRSSTSEPRSFYTDRSLLVQMLLSFGAIRNSQLLANIENRIAALDTTRFLLIYVLSTINSFWFGIFVTGLKGLKGITRTIPYEILYHNAYWFARIPGVWCDGFVFTM